MSGIECAFSDRLGRAAELRRVRNGELAMTSFSVAVEDGDKGNDGDTQPTWVRVVLFGDRAEELVDRLTKGTRCYCEGRTTLNTWTGRDGIERTGLSVVATVVQPLGQIGRRRPSRSRGSAKPERQPASDQPFHDDPLDFV
jgi:single-strand DNA-binding protein